MVKRMVTVNPGPWQVKSATTPASSKFDDSKWLQSKDPLQMGADGDVSASAWYRTHIKVAKGGDYTLRFTHTAERGAVFLDGRHVDTAVIFAKEIVLKLKANTNHTLSIFTAHNGRNKLIFKIGVIDTLDIKGIEGPVTLQRNNGQVINIVNWRMRGGPCGSPLEMGEGCVIRMVNTPLPQHNPSHPLSRGELKGRNSPTLYRATLNLPLSKQSYVIWRANTTSLSYGSVWVNGHNLGRYPEKIKINGMYIPECWLKPGNNTIVIYDENGVSPRDVRIEAEQAASRDVQTLQF
jgi:beta-galactosidase